MKVIEAKKYVSILECLYSCQYVKVLPQVLPISFKESGTAPVAAPAFSFYYFIDVVKLSHLIFFF